ncbi:MAG: HAD hydrolase-like protein [Anaerolineae bacterium]
MPHFKRLVLFDIDGTLLWPDRAGRDAMKIALEMLYGTAGPIDSYHFGGFTDRRTVRVLLEEAGLPAEVIWERFPRLGPVMAQVMRERLTLARHHIRPCTGGPELVAALQAHDDVLLGVLTGNLRETAAIKLEAAGYLPEQFVIGAFGDLSENRADLLNRAVEQARELHGVTFTGQQIVVIGDTPHDITCGRERGARSIAVLTGWNTRAELEAYSPNYLFDDLSDTHAVLGAIFDPTNPAG